MTDEPKHAEETPSVSDALAEIAAWPDFRVMFQYHDPIESGPSFTWTTVKAPDGDAAVRDFLAGRESHHPNLSVVQVVESNGAPSGFDKAEIMAQRTPEEVALYHRKLDAEEAFWAAERARKEEGNGRTKDPGADQPDQ